MHGTCQGSTQWGAAPSSPDFPKQPSQSPYRQLRKQVIVGADLDRGRPRSIWLLPPVVPALHRVGFLAAPGSGCRATRSPALQHVDRPVPGSSWLPLPPWLLAVWQESEKPGAVLDKGNKGN